MSRFGKEMIVASVDSMLPKRFFLKNDHSRDVFLYFRLFNSGFEPKFSGIESDHSANCATKVLID